MFFDDPAAAFANIRQALHPAGRLLMMVWQAHERNEWDVAIHQSLAAAESGVERLAVGPANGPGPGDGHGDEVAGDRARTHALGSLMAVREHSSTPAG
jgi:SAM-dependent methyltransferase